MKKLIFFIAVFLSAFSTKAEFGTFRKPGITIPPGEGAKKVLQKKTKNGTLFQILACDTNFFYKQIAISYNVQCGGEFTANDARNALLDGILVVTNWKVDDLINSGLTSRTSSQAFPMKGSGTMEVLAGKGLNGITVPLIKVEGPNACVNVVCSKSLRPYHEDEKIKDTVKNNPLVVANLPTPKPSYAYAVSLPAPTQQVVLDWPTQPTLVNNQQLLQVNPVIPVQPVFTVLPQKQCCNTWSRPTPAPNPTGNGFPSEGNPGWGELPVSGDPGWGGHGVSYNNDPIAGDPGWNGNQPTYWSNGNTGNNGGNTNNGNGPVE